ncbi:MAG TPA: serine protease, partial [Planctomycetes bacterium]|nr:serine protease [Planctomycetota bacterium]
MIGRNICLFMCLMGILSYRCGRADAAAAEVRRRSLDKSVVMIRSVQQEFDYVTPWKQAEVAHGIGSGFIITGRRILTNAHNVSNCKYVEVRKEYGANR